MIVWNSSTDSRAWKVLVLPIEERNYGEDVLFAEFLDDNRVVH